MQERIIIDEKKCNGKPIIKGTRITVKTVLVFLAAGDSEKEILNQHPSLKVDDIRACIKFEV